MLTWVRIEDLVIDPAYQRPIGGEGRRNIRAIVAEFQWARFAPLILAAAPGGKFAIIDGQHRATAAAVLGIPQLPAQVVIAGVAEQAAAFKAINGRVTRINPLSLHAAAVTAGEPRAVQIAEIAAQAEVEILRYPKAHDRIGPRQTMAIKAIESGVNICGAEGVVTALTCITQTSNDKPGALGAATIKALCWLMADEDLRDAGEPLLQAFDRIDLAAELEETLRTCRASGRGTLDDLTDRLRRRLREEWPPAAGRAVA